MILNYFEQEEKKFFSLKIFDCTLKMLNAFGVQTHHFFKFISKIKPSQILKYGLHIDVRTIIDYMCEEIGFC